MTNTGNRKIGPHSSSRALRMLRGFNHLFDIYAAARLAMSVQDSLWVARIYKASKTVVIAQCDNATAARDMSDGQYAQEFGCSFNAAITSSYHGRLLGEAES